MSLVERFALLVVPAAVLLGSKTGLVVLLLADPDHLMRLSFVFAVVAEYLLNLGQIALVHAELLHHQAHL